jgi:hypothetical protein
MGFSLKKLAQMCLQSEMQYAHAGLSIEPSFVLKLLGKRYENQVHVLTGPEGRHLTGLYIAYSPSSDRTLVLVRCSNVRDFLAQMNTVPEDFVEENWIEQIQNGLQATSPVRLGIAGSC